MEDDCKGKKERNPEESANVLSRLCFTWMFPILWKGYKAPLEKEDIFSCHKDRDSHDLVEKLEKYVTKYSPGHTYFVSISKLIISSESG